MAQNLVPDAKDKLAKFKNQVSSEMGVPSQIIMVI